MRRPTILLYEHRHFIGAGLRFPEPHPVLLIGGAAAAAAVEVKNLTVSFRGRRLALDTLTLRVEGGVVGILGPNGAGKTTLLSVLATVLRVPAGSAWVGGHDVGTAAGRQAARQVIGWLPQRFDLAGGMTLRDTVAYAAWANGVAARDCYASAIEALRLVDLEERAPERVRRLSGGQRQRLGLAAAVAHRPAVLLLDEPTAGLDPQQRVRFRHSIRAAAQLRTVLLSSHLLEDIGQVCDTVVVLDGGRILFDGSPKRMVSLGAEDLPSDRDESSSVASPLEAGYLRILRDGGQVST